MDSNAKPPEQREADYPSGEEVGLLLSSQQLLQGRNEIRIAHSGCIYSLRVTRQGKLILTK
ncbi:MAG: hemin uptake protein HemP [Rhodocyclaceae bacterium]|nr:MAG: hemin uptake protein HemP [Rhodocyclaceae bacterium]